MEPCPAQQLPIPIQLPSRLPKAPYSAAPAPLVQQACSQGQEGRPAQERPACSSLGYQAPTGRGSLKAKKASRQSSQAVPSRGRNSSAPTTATTTTSSSTTTRGEVGLPARTRPAAGPQHGLKAGNKPAFNIYCSKQVRKSKPEPTKQARLSADCSSSSSSRGRSDRSRQLRESMPHCQQQEAVQEACPPVVLQPPADLRVNGVIIPRLNMAAVAQQQQLDKEEEERLQEEKKRLEAERIKAAQAALLIK